MSKRWTLSLSACVFSLAFVAGSFILYREWNIVQIISVGFYTLAGYLLGKRLDKWQELAIRDGLTNVFTRRYACHTVPKMLRQAKRKQLPLAVCVIDLDNFKEINDQYGHDEGDVVLKHVANILTRFAHKRDIVARWGGDEFLLVLADTDKPAPRVRALEKELEKLSVRLKMDIGMSIGAAVYPHQADTFEELIHLADQQMYQNKGGKPLPRRASL